MCDFVGLRRSVWGKPESLLGHIMREFAVLIQQLQFIAYEGHFSSHCC